jgi:holliday junction DNA helicase RuvA
MGYDIHMISFISGRIIEISERHLIVDVGGLGYGITVTDGTASGLRLDSKINLWTYLAVRENALDLYGFRDQKEHRIFSLLITISGIGPKSAINILSIVSIDSLLHSIKTGSVGHLVKVSGIGKKTAEKIVLELRDKVSEIETGANVGMTVDMDVIEGLQALGYTAEQAREALKNLDVKITDTGARLKSALKLLS